MTTCIVIGAGNFAQDHVDIGEGNFCIAVDGGYAYCRQLGIEPDLIIGDMDSLPGNLRGEIEETIKARPEMVVCLCPEKDDTDMLAALRIGMQKGYKDYRIYGALGGRMEHTIANIQCLCYLKNNGARGTILEEGIAITVIKNEKVSFGKRNKGYLSLFSLGERAEGVTITGMKYPLNYALVTNDYPIGISNEFIGEEGMVEVKNGMLLAILSPKP